MKRLLKKLDTKKFLTFLILFWNYASMFIITESKDHLFLHMR